MSNDHGSESRKRQRSDDVVIWEDFEQLARRYPDFRRELDAVRAKQQQTGGSFSSAVTQEFNIALTRALIHSKFSVLLPNLPADRLCPPVPNRWAYVQWLHKDLLPLLCEENDYFVTTAPLKHCGLDIGTGASCIYPILFASSKREWNMIGTEIDSYSIKCARDNIEANQLEDRIQIKLVTPTREQQSRETEDGDTSNVTSSGGPIARAFECCDDSSQFDFVMTNPPFFDTTKGIEPRADDRDRTPMTEYEGSYPGGEVGFVCDMIRDSLLFRDRVGWYSTMCGKKSSFARLKQIITQLLGPGHVQTMEVSPGGYMTRWFLAWTFRRPKIKSPSASIAGGTHYFEVNIAEKLDAVDTVAEVVTRINTYCETLPGWNLSTTVTTTETGRVVRIVEVSPPPVSLQQESLPERVFDGVVPNWDSKLFLPKEGHFLIEVTVSPRTQTRQGDAISTLTVSVSLDSYRHSVRGAKVIEKIRNQIEGEVCRSNRRWRRILKRQAEQNNA